MSGRTVDIFLEPTRFADVLEGKGGQRGEVRMTPGFWPEQPERGSCYRKLQEELVFWGVLGLRRLSNIQVQVSDRQLTCKS